MYDDDVEALGPHLAKMSALQLQGCLGRPRLCKQEPAAGAMRELKEEDMVEHR